MLKNIDFFPWISTLIWSCSLQEDLFEGYITESDDRKQLEFFSNLFLLNTWINDLREGVWHQHSNIANLDQKDTSHITSPYTTVVFIYLLPKIKTWNYSTVWTILFFYYFRCMPVKVKNRNEKFKPRKLQQHTNL